MTFSIEKPHLSAEDFEAALRSADPNVQLAPPWLLRGVITYARGMLPTGLQVPDEQLCVLEQAQFVRFIEDQELPLPADLPKGPELILLQKPDESWLGQVPAGQALLRYWRLLVRARVEAVLRRLLAEGRTPHETETEIERRIQQLGHSIFNEARHVLTRERRLLASDDDLETYVKFAAAFVELRAFAPKLMPHIFPSIDDVPAVAKVLEADLPPDLVVAARPAGAAEPSDGTYQPLEPSRVRRGWWATLKRWFIGDQNRKSDRSRQRKIAAEKRDALMASADRAAAAGNQVRAGILRAHAYRGVRDEVHVVPAPAAREIDHLVDRLQLSLGFDADQAAEWREALRPLLGPASSGWWSAEGRLLYDLQKVCVDHEREIYSVNVIEWIVELGRRKLSRPLPKQRLTLSARHLQSAAHRLTRCRLSTPQRRRLDHLLHLAYHEADHRLRLQLTAPIVTALDGANMTPRNAVEAVARDKLVQELLDSILRDGYLTFGSVRDAISRNVLRCRDLTRLTEWLGYDQLMKLDLRLGDALDGVYRRGEIYRYLFQKLSSLLFAWPGGRLLTRTVILPIAGSYLLLEAIQHTIGLLINKLLQVHFHLIPGWKMPDRVTEPEAFEHFNPANYYKNPGSFGPWVVCALLVFAIVNWTPFRRGLTRALGSFFRGVSFLLFELPERLIKNRVVMAVLNSRTTRLTFRYGIKPLAFVMLSWWALPQDSSPVIRAITFGAVFLLVNLLLNSRTGRALEQALLHALRVGWVRFTSDMLAHALRGIVRFFERIGETVDRVLYAVDEWLRFRSGQRKRSFLLKAMLSVIWFYIAYVARFAINLLFEPQINPIKHFPVVTVSHKLLLPFAIPGKDAPSPFGALLMNLFGMSRHTADTTAGTVIWGIPGIFGFLAWELKENWKLYRANMPTVLKPVHFGSHGESIAEFLRPGFHSGTLPKAYARLRKAHRSQDTGERVIEGMEFPLAVHKHLEAIEHAEEGIRHFVERSFLSLLNRHPAFAETPIVLSELKLGATRIAISLACPSVGEESFRLSLEHVSGWIVATVAQAGWADLLPAKSKSVFADALGGLYRMSAVEIITSDIDAAFAPRKVVWELRQKNLVIRPADRTDIEVKYPLYEERMDPKVTGAVAIADWPTLVDDQILFSERPIPWNEWVALWHEADSHAPSPGDATQDPAEKTAAVSEVGLVE